AGLVPRLRMRERWTVLSSRPGVDPFMAVARSILPVEDRALGSDASDLAHDLQDQPALLACRLATLAAASESRVLLFVDQLEEIFTQGVPAPERERFFTMLALAADDPLEPVRVIYTIRDDYLGRVSSVQSVFVLGPLDETRLRRVITSPLDRLGYAFDAPGIVDEMLAEVRDSSAALPLLQFACRALWDARDVSRRLLLESSYRSQGGVAGALARHADVVLAGMVAEDQRVSRQILTRLVVGANARRIVDRDELLAELPASAASVLDRLLTARLLVLHRTLDERDTSIEIAHESLLSMWTRLARWLEESGEERRLLMELDEAVSFWERRGRRSEETWSIEEIRAVRRRAESLEIRLPDRVLEFFARGQRRADASRRRTRARWIAVAIVAATLLITALALADVFRRQRDAAEQQAAALRLARGNLGRVELTLEAFDWIDGRSVPVPISELPDLQLRLYAPAGDDVRRPGEPVPDELVTITRDRIEAPGGTAFLRIDGRGRGLDRCAASWVRLIALPGYADRDSLRRITITIPTCQASLAQTVHIPEGEFIYGGPGLTPTQRPEYAQPEHQARLAGFRIDATEVSNAKFAMFSKHAQFSGYAVPVYPSDAVLRHAGAPDSPVAGIDAHDAEAYCRFMGKRLPTDHEWTKAARGGLVIDGRPNPEPRRLYPWGRELARACVNLDGEGDPYAWMAPVTALECGASPYGVLNMAGNAAEWIARDGQTDDEPLRVVRGGAANSPLELEQVTTVFRNLREARIVDFATGVRCVIDEDLQEGSVWQKH
ncbi:MAG TPA: SUMF1/EgtB/PvdO family nonheme iron enzyme, partial [Enhygromyxa sp.]|nr:SUMF1/EgtB/PvdO family nonheme iron enzyme [Enhygromyxa sp.]